MARSKRQFVLEAERDAAGRLKPVDAMARFASKCAFDPTTGCVMWTGTTTAGHGHNEPYGRFKFEGRLWLAHRWAALHIHGYEIDGLQVDHNCPAGPSTLCVQHVKPETAAVNRELQHTRPGRAFQSLDTRRYWVHVAVGIEQYRPVLREAFDVPFYTPPAWLRPYMAPIGGFADDCLF